jgi:hypothetical protein
MKVKRHFLFTVALGLAFCLAVAPAWGDDFIVIAGGGTSGKVLKTQVLTSNTSNNTLGDATWAKLDSPQWTYTKLSATSYLVITYQDSLYCTGGWGFYQLRVNDQPSAAGLNAAVLIGSAYWKIDETTGVWLNLPKGDINLSVWQRQVDCTACNQNAAGWTTNVTVMEIEH